MTAWATRELGLSVAHVAGARPVTELIHPGLRRNPRRAQLWVSTVLGKHLPTPPADVIGAADALADLVSECLNGAEADVFGFCETATGLGHAVAARLGAAYLSSTRRAMPGVPVADAFEEGHSHATTHLLLPVPADAFDSDRPLVLVDDEVSSGATALDAIRALHRHYPRRRYVVASLVDMRNAAQRAADVGIDVEVEWVSLAQGETTVPADLTARVAALPDPVFNPVGPARGSWARVELPWPAAVPDGGRHGFRAADYAAFDAAVTAAGKQLRAQLPPGRPVIVLGHEELMYLPVRIAAELDVPSWFQTTTRSPAYVLDTPGFPMRRGFRFTAPESDPDVPRYLYNAAVDGVDPVLVLVVDEPADTPELVGPGGVVDVLTAAGEDVVVAVVAGADPEALRAARA